MKKWTTILLLVLIIIGLYLPDLIRKPRFHMESLDSMVEVWTYYETENGSEYGSGSGFVLSNSGAEVMIATCEHVVEGEPKWINVIVNDEKYQAKVVRASENADLAIISIRAELDIEPTTLSEAALFSTVYAAGYPGSKPYEQFIHHDKSTGMAVTQGKVKYIIGGFSGKPFQIIHTAFEDFGFSGGPLIDWKSDIVGVAAFGNEDYYGAISSWELMKLCKEIGVGYTHNFNFRLVKDLITWVLIVLIIYRLIPDDNKENKENKEK